MRKPTPMTASVNICDIVQTALEGGEAISAIYHSDFSVQYKKDESPLTLADQKSHEMIVASLEALYRDIPVLSEESRHIPYEERRSWKCFWLLDPLDGTKEFVKRNGEFTVNIALIEKDVPVLGVVYAPDKQLLYFALKDEGAFLTKDAARTGLCRDPDALKAVSCKLPLPCRKKRFTVVASRTHMSGETESYIAKLQQKYGGIDLVSVGSSLKFCLVAEGRADTYPRFAPTMEWDTAAGQVIVEQTGGRVLDAATGEPLRYNKEDLRNPSFIARRPYPADL